jgi:predicted HTH domain antitoxin
MMLARMNGAAFDVLMRELTKEGVPKFANYTNNRLKNEHSVYAFLVNHFAN